MQFRVKQPLFSRAGEVSSGKISEYELNNLKLAFFKDSPTGLSLTKFITAQKSDTEDTFTALYSSEDTSLPGYVVAFANIDDNLETNSSSPFEVLIDASKVETYLPMSSVRYFTEDGKPVFYTKLERKNFIEGSPAEIILERMVAKATLNRSENCDIPDVYVFHNAQPIALELIIDGWGITMTDAATFMMKNIRNFTYSQLQQELGSNGENWKWNHDYGDMAHSFSNNSSDTSFPVFHWACSLNYDLVEFPSGDESVANTVDFIKYSDIINNPIEDNSTEPTPLYLNETTRPGKMYGVRNALPLVAIAAHYEIKDSRERISFMREGDMIFTEAEYETLMSRRQSSIFMKGSSGIEKITTEQFWELCERRYPDRELQSYIENMGKNETLAAGYVAPLLKNITAENVPSGFCNAEGLELDFSDPEVCKKINLELMESCGLMEYYKDGCCVFEMPVRHLRDLKDGNEATGCYGIVRNHHYELLLSSVSGWGRGIPDKEWVIEEEGVAPRVKPYRLNCKLSIVPWTVYDNGDIDIIEDTEDE